MVEVTLRFARLSRRRGNLKQAAGEARNTEALARLAQTIVEPEKQIEVWDQIGGFTQDVQQEIIKRVSSDRENLGELVDKAAEGAFGYRVVRNCPYDCSTVPQPLKEQVANMIRSFQSQDLSNVDTCATGEKMNL